MSKHIFKNIDIKDLGKPVFVTPMDHSFLKRSKSTKKLPVPDKNNQSGYSLEDGMSIEQELRQKREHFEEELRQKREHFEEENAGIRENAENWAFEKIKSADQKYEAKLKDAETSFAQKIQEAEAEAAKILKAAEDKAKQVEAAAHKTGHEQGYELGYQEGKAEVERLVARLNIIVSSAVKKRNLILEEAEAQLIDLVITIARKVVKTITQEQKRVVYDNIAEALKMLRGQTEVTIRVNIEDLQMTTRHKKEFIEMVETIEHIKMLEDNTVDKGGCIITSDFGSIDARISTQLSNIEEQIKRLVPVVEIE